uniref:DNA replication licensing factor MCM5 putative n=1 Tax=Albugo laibachii Nc14 TaxID=890382 RepID=F0W885_9STRA|nr:DNA replication licensing factor MCM5 putative [Albugo laibachii Nc14]|eukprot:CCA17369.1 DNA replication licensing factor MCM5 putative [Albugo laibachii Nc14]
MLLHNPKEHLFSLEVAAKHKLKQILRIQASEDHVPDIQVIPNSDQVPSALRQVHAHEINRLIKLSLKEGEEEFLDFYQCDSSTHKLMDLVVSVFRVIVTEIWKSVIKIQESPEVVPTREMPRNIAAVTDRKLVDKASPGSRVSIIGITSVFDENGAGRARISFTSVDEEQFHEMACDRNLYCKLAKNIAPSIHVEFTNDIKVTVACLLVSGSRKRLPDGMILRGDINVSLLGDPFTTKSQCGKSRTDWRLHFS